MKKIVPLLVVLGLAGIVPIFLPRVGMQLRCRPTLRHVSLWM